MLQSISTLFEDAKRERVAWSDADVRHGVQEYLRDVLLSDRVYCQGVSGGVVVVRVGSPALHLEANLLERDVRLFLKKDARYSLKSIRVVLG